MINKLLKLFWYQLCLEEDIVFLELNVVELDELLKEEIEEKNKLIDTIYKLREDNNRINARAYSAIKSRDSWKQKYKDLKLKWE